MTQRATNGAAASPDGAVHIDHLVDDATWNGAQKMALALICLTVVLDGFDNLVFGLAIPAIMTDWRIPATAFGPVLAFGFVGLSAGTLIAGPLGDRFGRKPVLSACVLVFGVFTLGLALARDTSDLTICRTLAGLGLGGALPNATALIAELTPRRQRGVAVTLGALSVSIGGIIGAAVASVILPLSGWRTLFAIGGGTTLLLFPALVLMLPESPKFLARRVERRDRLVRTLRRLSIPHDPAAPIDGGATTAAGGGGRIAQLFRRDYVVSTIALWLAFLFAMTNGYLLVSWIPTILRSAGFSLGQSSLGLFAFNVGGLLGALGAAMLMQRLGSRILIVFAVLGMVVSMVFALADASVEVTYALLFATGVCVIAVNSPLFAIAAYIYPTEVRSVGTAFALSIGRLGAIASSFIGASVADRTSDQGSYFAIVAVLLAGSAASLLLLRRHIPAVR